MQGWREPQALPAAGAALQPAGTPSSSLPQELSSFSYSLLTLVQQFPGGFPRDSMQILLTQRDFIRISMLRYLWQPALHAALSQPCRALPHTQVCPASSGPAPAGPPAPTLGHKKSGDGGKLEQPSAQAGLGRAGVRGSQGTVCTAKVTEVQHSTHWQCQRAWGVPQACHCCPWGCPLTTCTPGHQLCPGPALATAQLP